MKSGLTAVSVLLLTVAPAAANEKISGLFNTGASEEVEGENGTLDVRFHPCADDAALTCASIENVHEPDGPSGRTVMPDGQPIVGFTMIEGLEARGRGRFREGKINAVDESLDKDKMVWYGVKVNLLDSGDLELTGCVAFICPRKMLWKKVSD